MIERKQKIWIYEYKDDETPIGATLVDTFVDGIDEEIILPHLQEPWHWRIEFTWEDIKDE